jgi:hypothetical protein
MDKNVKASRPATFREAADLILQSARYIAFFPRPRASLSLPR